MKKRTTLLLFIALILTQITFPVLSKDWPMWRYDEGRSAYTPEELPAKMELLWTWQFSQREPVWDDLSFWGKHYSSGLMIKIRLSLWRRIPEE